MHWERLVGDHTRLLCFNIDGGLGSRTRSYVSKGVRLLCTDRSFARTQITRVHCAEIHRSFMSCHFTPSNSTQSTWRRGHFGLSFGSFFYWLFLGHRGGTTRCHYHRLERVVPGYPWRNVYTLKDVSSQGHQRSPLPFRDLGLSVVFVDVRRQFDVSCLELRGGLSQSFDRLIFCH